MEIAPLPAFRITPPLCAPVEVKLTITWVVLTVGITTRTTGVVVLEQLAENSNADIKNRKKDIFRIEEIFMQIKR